MTRPSIVVLRALGLGDLLTGVPALRALRDAYPKADITLAAPSALTPIAALSGAVDGVADTAPPRPLPRALHGADLAVDLHGRGPESTRLLLATQPQRLIGFTHPDLPATRGLPRWTPEEHEVARWCRLLTECGIPADPGRLELPRPAVPSPVPRAVVVHPGAGSAARRWPAGRWAAVARELRAAGLPVVVTGSPAERGLAEEVAAAAGMAHLAAAYARPAVTLAGPVPPRLWGPPRRPWHRVLWAGRYGDPHGREPDPGLLELRVADVVAAARDVLETARPGWFEPRNAG